MIQAHSISKRFGWRVVLRNVDLKVDAGQLVALLGPNGAGKSTLLRILAGLGRPSVGRVRIAGFELPAQAVAARARIGFLGHQSFLYQDLSAEQNLAFYARLYGLPKADKRIKAALKLFDLELRRNEPVRTFSRGMQQRLALGRALLHRPKVLLLDEPHSGLDRESVDVLDEVLRAEAQRGTAILMATHDMERTQRLASRVEVLAGGQLAASWGRRKLAAKTFPREYDRLLRAAQQERARG